MAELATTIVAGTAIVVATMIAAARNQGVLRRGMIITALGYLIWDVGSVALFAGIYVVVFWLGFRLAAQLAFTLAAAGAEGGPRGLQEWLEVLLEGFLTVSGIFGLAWMAAQAQHVVTHRAPLGPLMLWLLAQILLMSIVCGFYQRTLAGYRGGSLISMLSGLVVLTGDVFALVTGHPKSGIGFWLAGQGLMAVASLALPSLMFKQTRLNNRPRRMRWWQLPIAYCAAYVLLPIRHDVVLNTTLSVLVVVMFLELIVQTRRSERLWDSLAERSRLYEELLLDSQDVIIQVNSDRVIEFVNPAAAAVLSMSPEDLLGKVLRDYWHPDDLARGQRHSAEVDWSKNASIQLEARFRLPAGIAGIDGGEGDGTQWRWIEWSISLRPDGSSWVLAGRDVSVRVRLQEELEVAARLDALTGLVNRGAFLGVVDGWLGGGVGVAVLFVDLDGFKLVNDTMGHGEGDLLLCRAAECLRQAVGGGDVVARLGGDEFAVLLVDGGRVGVVVDAVVTAFNGFDDGAVGRPSVSASVGVVVADSGSASELLRDADLAMYRAKQRGGASAVVFEPWMSERVMEHSRLRADLEVAVRDELLAIYLQPVVDLHTRQWEGFEALVRWPVGSETWSPAQFLPVAEESGLIVPMGAWVLRESLRQLAGWRDDRLGMAVNVSALQLVGTDFFDVTMAALEASGVAAGRLTLEITEQAAIQDLGRTASRLELLRSEGVHVAIDDFGTGFSSLQYLSRLPVDILKIDRKFVWGLGQHAEDDVLVRSMLGLAAELGLEVIAEGVETRRQADLLLEYGCRLAQGFLFSPPRPIEELRASDPFVSPALIVPRPRTGERMGERMAERVGGLDAGRGHDRLTDKNW
jgi:diguanylate cyclase (GGDEF)-like protein/PAS domain S-box-containing protein